MYRVGIIGFGFMGAAVARALRKTDNHVQLAAFEKEPSRREYATQELGALDYLNTPRELWSWADLVVLAVKPQDLESTVTDLLGGEDRIPESVTIVSVLAGTSIARIQEFFGTTRVVRMMPNLAAEIGKAVVGISWSSEIDGATRKAVRNSFSGLGTLLEVPESGMPAITGLCGSGIAFVFEFINAMALGGVEQGLPYSRSLEAARDVVESAACLLRESGVHPEEMVGRVSSPAGTTITGIHALARGGMRNTVMDAVGCAANRSRELEA